jgi:hypothetical protein
LPDRACESNNNARRPARRRRAGAGGMGGPWLVAAALTACLPGCNVLVPSNARQWSPDQALLAYARFDGERVTVHNIRNCAYSSADNFTVEHYDKTFDLGELDSVDFIMVPFSDMPGGAHTFLSFGFGGRDYLAVSVEIRKELGEAYSSLKGFVNGYEIMYVIGDERDLIQLRTIHRLDDVYVYRAKASPAQSRALFVDVLERANKLVDEPEFYNTLTNNCTTNVLRHVNRIATRKVPYTYQVLLPAYSDRLAYDMGLLDTRLPFEEMKRRARVNPLAFVHRDRPDFSAVIRDGAAVLR